MGSARTDSPKGRQAEARRNDRIVLEAAREVLATEGADAPVAAIARRAGVGIGTLYRRYGSKEELLQGLCLSAMEDTIAIAKESLAETDPWVGFSSYIGRCVEVRTGALGSLAGRVEVSPEMLRAARTSRRLLTRLLSRAQQDGSARKDLTPLDIAWVIEVFGRRPVDATPTDRLLAIALAGLRAEGSQKLPTPAPSVKDFEGRWTSDSGRSAETKS